MHCTQLLALLIPRDSKISYGSCVVMYRLLFWIFHCPPWVLKLLYIYIYMHTHSQLLALLCGIKVSCINRYYFSYWFVALIISKSFVPTNLAWNQQFGYLTISVGEFKLNGKGKKGPLGHFLLFLYAIFNLLYCLEYFKRSCEYVTSMLLISRPNNEVGWLGFIHYYNIL